MNNITSVCVGKPGDSKVEGSPWYIANKVGHNVGNDDITAAEGRFARQGQSRSWLVQEAREKAGVDPDSPVYVRPDRPARCGQAMGSVSISGGDRSTKYHGIETCGSIWACPVCSSLIRSVRSNEISEAAMKHIDNGGKLILMTETIPHKKSQSLGELLAIVPEAWKRQRQSRSVKSALKSCMVTGTIRTLEITVGTNGWHPHLHVLIFIEDKNIDCTDLKLAYKNSWSTITNNLGADKVNEHGFDWQESIDGQVLASYISKVQEKSANWSVGAEMARGDLKHGRNKNGYQAHITPFDLLDNQCGWPVSERKKLWLEYVKSTKGKRAITWSRGLKKLFEIGEESDEDIAASNVGETISYLLKSRDYYKNVRRNNPSLLGTAIDLFDSWQWSGIKDILGEGILSITSNDNRIEIDNPIDGEIPIQ